MIPPEIIEQIRETVSLVEYVGREVALKKAGTSFKGLCPFHNERTPSFHVNAEKNTYHCFGCGAHGDIFKWVTEREGLSFVDAAEALAQRAGIQIPRGEAGFKQSEQYRAVLAVNELALKSFRHALKVLPQGRAAAEYLAGRGVTAETIDRFGLGFALPQWDFLTERLLKENYKPETLVEAGLARRAQDGSRLYDYFRDRVMFPIYTEKGDLVAFGGRVLDKSEPKYLNSPENPVFQKRQVLYGLDKAKATIAKNDVAYLVEGYLDVIGMHQAGFASAVAPLGTALTEQHLLLLKRYAKRIVMLFDGDKAGIAAALKSARPVLDHGFTAKVVVWPDGQDAFDLSTKVPPAELRRMIKAGIPLTDFVVNQLFRQSDCATLDGKVAYLRSVYAFLEGYPVEVAATQMVKNAAVLCGVDPEDAAADWKSRHEAGPGGRKLFKKAAPVAKFDAEPAAADAAPAAARGEAFDFYLLRLVGLHSEAWPRLAEALSAGLALSDARAVYLHGLLDALSRTAPRWTAAEFLERIDHEAVARTVREDIATRRLEPDWERQFSDTVRTLAVQGIRRERGRLAEEASRLALAGDAAGSAACQRRLLELRRREEELVAAGNLGDGE